MEPFGRRPSWEGRAKASREALLTVANNLWVALDAAPLQDLVSTHLDPVQTTSPALCKRSEHERIEALTSARVRRGWTFY